MGKWASDGQERLEAAAMELFLERGFQETTVADIAARAGLTERTFFRYFEDKREVLFAGSEVFEARFTEATAAAPVEASPLEAVTIGLEAVAVLFESFGARARERQTLVVANAELQERELIKLALLGETVAATLRDRGVGEPGARLAAKTGLVVLQCAFERWTEGPESASLRDLIAESMAELRSLADDGAQDGPSVSAAWLSRNPR